MSNSFSIHNQDIQLFESEYVDSLPVYCSGAYVSPETPESMSTSMLKIQIKNLQNSYDIHDLISGEIKFSPKNPENVSSIVAVLECQEYISQSKWMASKQKNSITTLQSHVIPLSLLSTHSEFLPGFVYTFPFVLQVPEYRLQSKRPTCVNENQEHNRLVPSLGTPPEISCSNERIENGSAYISYSVKGLVKVKRHAKIVTLCQGHQVVNIHPSYILSPLVQYNVNQHPYSIVHNFLSKPSLMKYVKKGQIMLELSKPTAVSMNESTDIKLLLTTAQFPLVQISNIQTKLTATTSFFNEKKTNIFELISFNTQGASWILNKHPSDFSHKSGIDLYTAEFRFSLTLPRNKLITPTFESCLMSRSYSLTVTVTMTDRVSYSLTVPINIVTLLNSKSNYPFELINSSDTSSISEGDSDKLPQYDSGSFFRSQPDGATGSSTEPSDERHITFHMNSHTLKNNLELFL